MTEFKESALGEQEGRHQGVYKQCASGHPMVWGMEWGNSIICDRRKV